MSTVLIIATDQIIGDLLGQLTDLAGHVALFRRVDERPSEAVRALRPDVVMLDAGQGADGLYAAAAAAAEVGVPVVYFASTLAAAELREFALARGAKYFALPAGPKLLRQVLSAALGAGEGSAYWGASPVSLAAVSAAAAAVARARALATRSADLRIESRALRGEREAALADCRRAYGELREAVIAYTRELRGAGVSPDRTLEMVKAAVTPGLADARATAGSLEGLDDAVEWCLSAYYAA